MLKSLMLFLAISVNAFATDITFETYTNNIIQQIVTYKAKLENGVLKLNEKYTDSDGKEYDNNHVIKQGEQTDIFTLDVMGTPYVLSKAIMLDEENLKISFASRTFKDGETEYESFIVNVAKKDTDGFVIPQVGDPSNYAEVRLVRTYGKLKIVPFGVKLKEIVVYSDAEGENEVGAQQF